MGAITLKKVLLTIAAAVILGGIGILLYPKIAGMKFKNDKLLSCSVSRGGGMLGGYREAELYYDENGTAKLKLREKETHADREVTTIYPADPAAFDHVRELVNSHDLYAASKRPMSPMRVLDGDTVSLVFDYEKDYFRIHEEQVLSPNMRAGFEAAANYLYSLAGGEGVRTVEAQTGLLYLRSGYTLQLIVKDAFDGKLDAILGEEHETSRFETSGIIMNQAEDLDVSGAETVTSAAAGTLIYDPSTRYLILFYEDYEFDHPVYVTAALDGHVSSACPLIREMEGQYSLRFN